MEEKYMYGRLLGEIYRMEKRISSELCNVSDTTIYGLIEGVERIVDSELNICPITEKEEKTVADILNTYFEDAEKLEQFTGFYEIEHELEAEGINRFRASKIITLLKSEGKFSELIEKMNSSGSPTECKTFEIRNW